MTHRAKTSGRQAVGVLIAALLLTPGAWAATQDPLDSPAESIGGVQTLSAQPLLAVATPGSRIVAVGLRGLIAYADDGGMTWRQAAVPVQVDLVAVQFVSSTTGWAAGHDGVILHTQDGGATWVKQLDTVAMQRQFVAEYARRVANGEAELQADLDQIKLNTEADSALPFLSIWFENEQTGYAVGSFGMIAATDDGGATWQPWLDHIDNPEFLNLNAIKSIAGTVYVAGERGSVYRLDRGARRFVAMPAPYQGTFFDLAGDDRFLLAVGLRGNAWRLAPDAVWQQVDSGVTASLTSATSLPNGEVVLTTDDGTVLAGSDEGRRFAPLPASRPMLFSGSAGVPPASLALAGYQGIEIVPYRTHVRGSAP